MKILFAYHEYYNRHRKFVDIVRSLGHEVKGLALKNKRIPGQININHVKEGFDLVWLLSPSYVLRKVITDEALNFTKRNNTPIAIYATYLTGIPYVDMMSTWEKIDFCFVMNKELANFLSEKGLGGYYVPMGFHPDQYYPVEIPKKHDISFMGTAQSSASKLEDKRVYYLNSLAKEFNLSLFGGRYKSKGLKSTPYSTHKEQREVYSSSIINLDLPFVNSINDFYREKLHIKNRFFEIAASKGFMVTANHPDFKEILDDTMVGYYDDIDSLIDILDYYIKNEELRIKMSEKMYNKIKAHTYENRFRYMLDIVEKR
jgi:glycosyltransferase involved in cell wall biosynthesis